MWTWSKGLNQQQLYLHFEGPIDALEEFLLVLARCSESKVIEVSSVYTIGAQEGSSDVPADRTATPPFVTHVAHWAVLCWAHSCKECP